jgi:hypothetical protein
MTVTQIRKTRTPSAATAAAAAPTPAALVTATDALQDAEALVATAMNSLCIEGNSPEAVTLGFAIERIRTALAAVGGTPADQD